MIIRRSFLRRAAVVTAAASAAALALRAARAQSSSGVPLGEPLPTRPLGRSSEQVTMLGVGGSHFQFGPPRESDAKAEAAIAAGIRFVDSAEAYGKGESERRIGRYFVPRYRDALFLMTKTGAKTAQQARDHLDASRKRMNVDVLDLWQMHAIQDADDVDRRIDNGVLDVLLEAKAAGKVRYLGFTGHSSTEAHLRMFERLKGLGVELDAVQMPINAVDLGYDSFIAKVLPTAVERGYGVLAMKTLAFGQFFGRITAWANRPQSRPPRLIPDRMSIAEALGYAWSQPGVCCLISGMASVDETAQNAGHARAFAPLDEAARDALHQRVASAAGVGMEFYKQVGVP